VVLPAKLATPHLNTLCTTIIIDAYIFNACKYLYVFFTCFGIIFLRSHTYYASDLQSCFEALYLALLLVSPSLALLKHTCSIDLYNGGYVAAQIETYLSI
jgi:hypothetical protein